MKISVQTPEGVSSATGFAESALGQVLRRLMVEGSASNRAIAEFLLRNPVRAAAWSIEELAAQTQTSTATLSRFARSAGHGGFPALRGAIAAALQDALQPVFKPVEKLRAAVARSGEAAGRAPVVLESVEASLANVREAAAALDTDQLAQLAERLVRARTVFTMGFGLSSHLAAMLALDLQPFCPQLVNVVEFGGTEVAAGRLMNIGEGDVLLVLSFPRYAADAVMLARYARDRGARVVAITDSVASPLATVAHQLLLAPAVHPVLSSSAVPALLVVEALVTMLMVSRGDHVAQAGKLTDAISAYLYSDKPRKKTLPKE